MIHTLSYAYPSSPDAAKAGLKDGDWCLEVNGALTGYASYAEALAAIPAISQTDRAQCEAGRDAIHRAPQADGVRVTAHCAPRSE